MADETSAPPTAAVAQTEAAGDTMELQHQRLVELTAAANKQYSLKNYNAAADMFSEATELQAELNGEMAAANAELLYQYGRCLYHVAVSKSDVLGGKVAGEKKKEGKKGVTNGEGSSRTAAAAAEAEAQTVEPVEKKAAEEVVEAATTKSEEKPASKPFFQFNGDENWDTDEDEEAEGGEDGQDEDEDDFATAYEILDIARVLLTRQLEEALADAGMEQSAGKDKGKAAAGEAPSEQQSYPQHEFKIRERLADTHDLQAEISLENERFGDAITDSRSALELKKLLFPPESSLLAEAHYKLSLALEFASVTSVRGEQGEEGAESQGEEAKVDEDMRGEAAKEMEAAIESCRLRVKKEESFLEGLEEAKRTEKEASIKDVKEMIEDMQNRLQDLRTPLTARQANPLLGGPAGAPDGSDPMAGLLGAILGESPAEQKARVEEATKGANDLTNLVRHKKKPAEAKADGAQSVTGAIENGGSANGKRKADQMQENSEPKKAKTADS
ncbi:hypothetical protein BDY21DRAFT_285475 [Lineolata rhizophorae]|uniref:Tetratricopeptide SHNi-TPR domain-containing protein n=1 Tax=Lineolata rhizophorae TaxID=578093 RepID=A0A6A6P154_9PEZI|nr:hypothetical protein BDY21DRAFT_285475 [Lineolata rhizophorae]